MKNLRNGLLIVLFISLMGAFFGQDSAQSVSAALVVTDTPTPTPDTPTPTPVTPSPTPVTPSPTPPSPGGDPSPAPSEVPTNETPSPVETPSVIPALGAGPRMSSIILYGTMLLALFIVVTGGWVKVWQAYRKQL